MPSFIRVNTLVVDEQLNRLNHVIHRLETAWLIAHSYPGLTGLSTLRKVESHLGELKKFAHATQQMLNLSAQTEQEVHSAGEKISSALMWQLGRWMPILLVAYGPEIIGGLALILLIAAERKIHPDGLINSLLSRAQKELLDSGKLVSNEAVVSLTAHAVDGADDFIAGTLGLPQPSHDGIFSGEDAVAAGAIGAAALLGSSQLQETPVRAEKVSVSRQQPAQNYHDLISRIPRAEDNAAQIRIEHYPDSETYVVYLGGTIEGSTEPSGDPWDMTSNVHAIAGMEAGSYLATTQAMEQAGITANDHVIVVGHSQGGLIAARLAASGDYAISDVVTVGAPTHHVSVPEHIRVVSIEHEEDIIPSLSGVSHPSHTREHMLVTRSVYSSGQTPQRDTIPAHNLSRYIETAAVMDRSQDTELNSTRQQLSSQLTGECEVTLWRARRIEN